VGPFDAKVLAQNTDGLGLNLYRIAQRSKPVVEDEQEGLAFGCRSQRGFRFPEHVRTWTTRAVSPPALMLLAFACSDTQRAGVEVHVATSCCGAELCCGAEF
jgi:hypothetical protein